jgi:hypothetical protein
VRFSGARQMALYPGTLLHGSVAIAKFGQNNDPTREGFCSLSIDCKRDTGEYITYLEAGRGLPLQRLDLEGNPPLLKRRVADCAISRYK